MDLFPYQRDGAAFLAAKGRALLADDMGLGKSAQAIAACREVDAGVHRVLVVCPASLVENWKREFKRFASEFRPIVQSYDRIARGGYESIIPPRPDVLILDEAHYLKSHKAKRTQAIFGPKCDGVDGLVERAKHVFLLTGTPAPNHYGELWPLLRAVTPDAIIGPNGKPMARTTFEQRFCRIRQDHFGWKIVGSKNHEDLKARLAPVVLRRKKDEVLKDLPPIRFDELALEGDLIGLLNHSIETTEQRELLQKVLEEKGVAGLKEIAPHVAQLRRLTGLAKVDAATQWVDDWRKAGGGKLVVFAHHRAVIDAMSAALDRAVVVAGSTESRVRQAAVDSFQNDPEITVFIGQIQAAGTGITLTAASDMLFVESSWVPAENEQAAMRIHRIGQRNACLVRFATLAGSIDEQIQRAVMRKTADISKLFS